MDVRYGFLDELWGECICFIDEDIDLGWFGSMYLFFCGGIIYELGFKMGRKIVRFGCFVEML